MNHHLFFTSNWKLLPGLDHLSKLKYFNWKSSLKISPPIFSPPVKSHDYTEKSTRQSSSGTEVEGNDKTPSTKKTTELKFYSKDRSNVNQACARRNGDSFTKPTLQSTTNVDTTHIHKRRTPDNPSNKTFTIIWYYSILQFGPLDSALGPSGSDH